MEPLAVIFCPQVVDVLASDVVENIAAEDESSQLERRRLQQKKAKLHNSLLHLHRLDRHNTSGKICTHALTDLRLSQGTVLKGSDESSHLDGNSVSDELVGIDDSENEQESPILEVIETVYEAEVAEYVGPSKRTKKKHPYASRWESSD